MSDLGFKSRAELVNFVRQTMVVDSPWLGKANVKAYNIYPNTITAAEIADNAITAAELADNSVDTNAIVNLAVTTGKIADSAVTTAKIADLNVTDPKLLLSIMRNNGAAKAIAHNANTAYNSFAIAGPNALARGVVPTTTGGTIATTGWYSVTINWTWVAAAGGSRGMTPTLNGAGIGYTDSRLPDTFGGSSGSWTLGAELLAAGTTVGVSFYQNQTVVAALNVTASMQIHFLSN